MSAIDNALDQRIDYSTDEAARAELAAIRAAVAERDAAIEQAVKDEREACAVICDDLVYCIDASDAIRARNETKEQA